MHYKNYNSLKDNNATLYIIHNPSLFKVINLGIVLFDCIYGALCVEFPFCWLFFLQALIGVILLICSFVNVEMTKVYGRAVMITIAVISFELLLLFKSYRERITECPLIIFALFVIIAISYPFFKNYYNNTITTDQNKELPVFDSDKFFMIVMPLVVFSYISKRHFSDNLKYWIVIITFAFMNIVLGLTLAKNSYLHKNGYFGIMEEQANEYRAQKAQAKAEKKLAEQKRKEEKLEELRQNKFK